MDDSTNMISTSDAIQLQNYVNNILKILEQFYNINKLTLNQDKTKFMVICQASKRNLVNNIKLHNTNFIIEQSSKIKILGIYFSSGLTQIATCNNIISKVNNRLNTIKK